MWAALTSPVFKLHFPADLAQFLEVWQCVCSVCAPCKGSTPVSGGLAGGARSVWWGGSSRETGSIFFFLSESSRGLAGGRKFKSSCCSSNDSRQSRLPRSSDWILITVWRKTHNSKNDSQRFATRPRVRIMTFPVGPTATGRRGKGQVRRAFFCEPPPPLNYGLTLHSFGCVTHFCVCLFASKWTIKGRFSPAQTLEKSRFYPGSLSLCFYVALETNENCRYRNVDAKTRPPPPPQPPSCAHSVHVAH